MIRREFSEGWYLFTQYDHSLLSGEIMQHWGNKTFTKIDSVHRLIYAITNHDMGWRDWDSSPRINPENKFPASFIDMYPEEQHVIWSKCFENMPDEYAYSSALVALHFSTFNNNLLTANPGNEDLINFRNKLYSHVSGILNIDPGSIDKHLPDEVQRGLKYIQIGDIISLAFCNGWESITIKDAPVDHDGENSDLALGSRDGLNYTVHPYPFAESKIEFSIEAVKIKGKEFDTNLELLTAIKNGEKTNFTFILEEHA